MSQPSFLLLNFTHISYHPAGKQYWLNIGPISTYRVQIGQHYNIGPMLVRYCGATVAVSQYWPMLAQY